MDKLNFVRDGESKLPPGFRFQPTDEEIVFQYLARKVFSYPLPASIIPELNIFGFDPCQLPGNPEQERYVFSYSSTNYRNVKNGGSILGRGGHWKAFGPDKRIICPKKTTIVGIRKTLVFYRGKHPNAARTDWNMNLYCIALSKNKTSSNVHQRPKGVLIQVGNWALCHIFMKKRSSQLDEVIDDNCSLKSYESTDDNCNLPNYESIEVDVSDTDSFSVSSSSSSSSPDSDLSEVSSNSTAKW